MTDLEKKDTVCIVLVNEGLSTWVFGAYENVTLARKRIEEQSYAIPSGATVHFINEIIWGVLE